MKSHLPIPFLTIATAILGLLRPPSRSRGQSGRLRSQRRKSPKTSTSCLIGNDHEYRSEETIPALARILARHHGFKCTVLFGINEETGTIMAGHNHMPGMEALESADGLVIFARFLALPDEQMKHLDDYLKRGGPVVGLRTSTHAFNYPKDSDSKYLKHTWTQKGGDFEGGFGHQVLGQSWVGHYGKNHQQSTRITIVPDKAGHAILRGVKDIWVQAGGYNAVPQDDWTILTMAQPLLSMEQDGKPDPEKEPKASEWTRTYQVPGGKEGRAFTSLYGASEDITNDGYRRMIVNAVYWSLGLEDQIKADSSVAFVGPYKPNTFTGREFAQGIKPSAYAGFTSPIPAHNNITPKNAAKAKAEEGQQESKCRRQAQSSRQGNHRRPSSQNGAHFHSRKGSHSHPRRSRNPQRRWPQRRP